MHFVHRTAARLLVGAVTCAIVIGCFHPTWGQGAPAKARSTRAAGGADKSAPAVAAPVTPADPAAPVSHTTAAPAADTSVTTGSKAAPAEGSTSPAEGSAIPAATTTAPPAAAEAPAAPGTMKLPNDLKSLISICPSVRLRLEKDHRIRITEERYRNENRAHIYLYLAEQKLPYMVSLGWFIPGQQTIEQQTEKDKSASDAKKKSKKDKLATTHAEAQDLLNPISEKNKALVVIDELGLVLPNPGWEPTEKTYDKADWNSVIGFDKVCDNDLNNGEKEFADATKMVPVNPKFNNNLGAILASKGDYKEAFQCFSRAIRENNLYAGAYSNRALVSLAIGKPDAALEDAVMSLKLLPDFMPGRIAYGRALMETGRQSEALKVAQTLKAEAPTEWQPMLLLADAQLANKEYRESKATLTRLSVLNAGNADIVIKLAHANEKLGDLDEAIKQGKKATQLAPNDARTHITLGRLLDANRDGNAARLQFERALDLKPDQGLRKSAMGAILRILISSDKMPIADEFSKKWIKQFPDDAAVHYNRAWIASQIEGGSVQECIDGYRKAIELDPSLKSVHYNLGLVLLKAGKNTDALRELRAFVKALPEDSDSASARELIKKLE